MARTLITLLAFSVATPALATPSKQDIIKTCGIIDVVERNSGNTQEDGSFISKFTAKTLRTVESLDMKVVSRFYDILGLQYGTRMNSALINEKDPVQLQQFVSTVIATGGGLELFLTRKKPEQVQAAFQSCGAVLAADQLSKTRCEVLAIKKDMLTHKFGVSKNVTAERMKKIVPALQTTIAKFEILPIINNNPDVLKLLGDAQRSMDGALRKLDATWFIEADRGLLNRQYIDPTVDTIGQMVGLLDAQPSACR